MGEILDFFHAIFPSLDTDVLLINTILSVFFLAIATITFYIILATRIIKWLSNEPKIIKEAITYISNELYNEDYTKKARKAYARKHFKSNFIKKIYINQCVELHKNISGDIAGELKILFNDLGLNKFVLTQFHGYDWAAKADAISVLSEMDDYSAYDEIISFVNHYKITLRYKAQVAAIALAKEKPFAFLTHVTKPISEWQQLQILHASIDLKRDLIPDFSQWFDHKIVTVVELSVKLATHFTQYNLSDKLIEKCKDKHPEISLQAIVAVKMMGLYEAKDVLIKGYPDYPKEHQLEILELLPSIGGNECIPFLKNIATTDAFAQRLNAIEALLKLGVNQNTLKADLVNQTDEDLNLELMVDHVLENRNV